MNRISGFFGLLTSSIFSLILSTNLAFAEGEIGAGSISSAPTSAGGGLAGMLPLILVFAVFYFLVIRPQSKRHKAHEASVQALKKGDKIITAGGIEGIVTKIDEANDRVVVQIATGIEIKLLRNSAGVKEVLSHDNKIAKPKDSKPKEVAKKPATKKKTTKKDSN